MTLKENVRNGTILKIIFLLIFWAGGLPAYAAKDFNVKNNTQSFLYVNGTSGNVGIGSAVPGQTLDVNGTARMTGFILTGNGAGAGNVLVGNGVGVGTWMPASTLSVSGGGSSQWTTVNTHDVYLPNNGNVGIGTNLTTTSALTVMNGNVGIGTWVPANVFQVATNTFIVNTNTGNVGIGSASPGTILDLWNQATNNNPYQPVQYITAFNSSETGSVTNETYDTSQPSFGIDLRRRWVDGNVTDLASIDAFGSKNWRGGLLFRTKNGQGSIGTPDTNAMMISPEGLVGIGTTVLNNALSVAGGAAIGSLTYAGTAGPSNGLIVEGNVGIGSITPGQMLDVQGTVRSTGLTMSGHAPIAGYVLTASDSAGDTTWSSAGGVSGWTVSGNNVYETGNGNVGIGTNLLTTAALTVMNGNVGIGTWVPLVPLQVVGIGTLTANGGGLIVTNGNVGIGTRLPQAPLNVFSSSTNAVTNPQIILSDNSLGGNGGNNYASIGTDGAGNLTFNASGNVTNFFNATGTYEFQGGSANPFTYAIINSGPTTGFGIESSGTPITFSDYVLGEHMRITSTGNVGIGTTVPGGELDVEGTLYPTVFYARGTDQNVGIGSLTPGQSLDVNGTVRMTGFTLTGNGAGSGNVLVGNGVGVGTWMPASTLSVSGGGSSQWTTVNTQDVYLPNNGNVGIGTSLTTTSAFTVMNGNVGIGTWVPTDLLDVKGNLQMLTGGNITLSGAGNIYTEGGYIEETSISGYPNVLIGASLGTIALAVGDGSGYDTSISSPSQNNMELSAINVGIGTNTPVGGLAVMIGNVGIGTWVPKGALDIKTGNNVLVESGNVGIGSLTPGTALDVTGTARMMGFTLTGNGAATGNVLVGNGVGVGTWMPASTLSVSGGGSSQWTTINTQDVYLPNNGNVGIGTNKTTTAALTVMNGNVGIGTWVPNYQLQTTGSISVGTTTTYNSATIWTGGIIGEYQGNGDLPLSSGFSTGGVHLENNGTDVVDVVQQGAYVLGNLGIGTTSITTSALTVMNGNVGIGTWVPGYPLHIVASTNETLEVDSNNTTSTSIQINNTSAGGQDFQFYSTGSANSPGEFGIWNLTMSHPQMGLNGTNQGAAFGTYATPSVVANAPAGGIIVSGNVGIGSTAPGTALDVNGTARATGFTLTGNGAGAGNVLVGNGVGVGTWMPASTLSVSGGGSSQWTTVNTHDVYLPNNGNVGIGTSLTTTSALTVMNGNVGIGTWVPQAMFDLGGNISTSSVNSFSQIAYLSDNSNSIGGVEMRDINSGVSAEFRFVVSDDARANYLAFSMPSSGNTNTIFGQTRSNMASIFGNLGNGGAGNGRILGVGTLNNNDMLFGTNNIERVRITSSGNVGIGSTAPGQLLDVQGSLRVLGNGNVGIGTSFIGGVGEAALTVMNGNVGIGTWLPTAALSFPRATTAAGGITFGTGAVDLYLDNSGSNDFLATDGYINVLGGVVADTGGGLTLEAGEGSPVQLSQYGGWEPAAGAQSSVHIPASGYLQATTTATQFLVDGTLYFGGGGTTTGSWTAESINSVFGAGSADTYNGSSPAIALGVTPTINVNTGSTGGYKGIFENVTETSVSSTATNYLIDLQKGGASKFSITSSGNVGIGSTTPGTALDVNGTARMTGFTLSGNGAGAGNVLVGNGVGVGTWMPASTLSVSGGGGSSGWTASGNNVYETLGGNVGIGTNMLTTAALSVMNGNVGIGTWKPQAVSLDVVGGNVGIGTNINNHAMLEITGNASKELFRANPSGQNSTVPFIINSNGNVGIGTTAPDSNLEIFGGLSGFHIENATAGGTDFGDLYTYIDSAGVELVNNGGNYNFQTNSAPANTTSGTSRLDILNSGNIGINSTVPGQLLDIFGTARMTGFTLTGNGAGAGNVLVGNGVGVGTWMPASTLSTSGGSSQWTTVNAHDVYLPNNGNVGIGTSLTTTSALTVMNGNVGIGTWVPGSALQINGMITSPSGTSLTIEAPSGQFLNLAGSANASNIAIGATISLSNAVTIGSATGASSMLWVNGGTAIGPSNIVAPVNGLFVQGNVGIGTITPGNQFVVNGAVGIGTTNSSYVSTIAPAGGMIVQGNVGIGSLAPGAALDINGVVRSIASGNSYFTGNIGVGSTAPGTALDVTGIARMTGLTLTGNGAGAGNVLVGNGVGVGTWMPASTLATSGGSSQWTTINTQDVYLPNNGNVGIGTSLTTTSALTVMNGNVGIGTWVPNQQLELKTGNIAIDNGNVNVNSGNIIFGSVGNFIATGSAGLIFNLTDLVIQSPTAYQTINLVGNNVGIGTSNPQGGLAVMNGNVGIGTWIPSTLLSINGLTQSTGDIIVSTSASFNGFIVNNNIGGQNQITLAGNDGGNNGGTLFLSSVGSANTTVISGSPNLASYFNNGKNVGVGTTVPGSALQVNNTFTFQSEYNNGSQGGAFTVNWNNGNKQKVTLTGSTAHTATFTAPTSGVTNLLLKVIQGSGNDTITWPGTVEWSGGVAPVLSTAASAVDIVTCYYDSTNYFCTSSLNFQT